MLSSRTLRRSAKNVRLVLSGNPAENDDEFRWRGKKVTKEVVGIHVLLTRSLFACDILRRFLRRVSLAKPTSAPCDSYGCTERSLNLALLSTQSREKHTAEPEQFGTAIAVLKSFSQ